MSTTTIGTSAALDSAMRRAFSDASVRLQPNATITAIIVALETLGVTATVEDGLLVLRQGLTEMSTSRALRSLTTKPEFQSFFVLSTADPKTWTREQKIEYIRTHGDEAYGRLCSQPVVESGVRVLDANMSRSDYAKLTVTEKMQFINEFGADGVTRVMGKK